MQSSAKHSREPVVGRTHATAEIDHAPRRGAARSSRRRRRELALAGEGLWVPTAADLTLLKRPPVPVPAPTTVGAGLRRDAVMRRWLLGADVLALLAIFAMVEVYAGGAFAGPLTVANAFAYLGIGLVSLAVLGLYGLYGRDGTRTDHTTTDDLPTIFHAVTVVTFASAVIARLVFDAGPVIEGAAIGWAAGVVCLTLGRSAARLFVRRHPSYVQRTIILGAGDIGQLMARKLIKHPEYGLDLVGFVDADPRDRTPDVDGVPILGSPEHLEDLVRQNEVERVIVAFSNASHQELLATVASLRALEVQVDIVPRLYEVVGPSVDINVFEGLAVVALPPARMTASRLLAKRVLDVVVSAGALLFAAPLIAVIAIAVKIESRGRGPLLYSGDRVGPQGRIFGQLKFRTMRPEFCAGEKYGGAAVQEAFDKLLESDPAMRAEWVATQKLTNDPRVTTVGRFLRRTSLDELPQLWNVLKGDLSLVGPRPLTQQEVDERYVGGLGYWTVPGLRPGLTGYWQISGRSAMSFEERIRLDTAYLTGWSLSLDISILAKTARALVATRGAY